MTAPAAARALPAGDLRAGILLMVATTFAYTVQDGLTRFLAGEYNTLMVVMIRYWFFAAFVLALALRAPGGLRAAAATRQPGLNLARAVLHIAEICLIVTSFTLIGLINTHAVFAVCPVLIAVLSVPMLGERVRPVLWLALAAGFAGILVILRPGSDLFTPLALLPLGSALLFALYSILTRRATQTEPAFVAFFWSAMLGCVLMTAAGAWFWQPMGPRDWALTAANGAVAVVANWLMIRTYAVAEAAAVQPYAYLQLVFVTLMGVAVFDERLTLNILIGAGLVVAAGLVSWVATRGRGA